MSRQEFKNFIRAAERNYSLREEIKKCNSFIEVLSIANNSGFKINKQDLQEDKISTITGKWFTTSKINIIRK